MVFIISQGTFNDIVDALVKGRQKFPKKGLNGIYNRYTGAACAVGAIAAGLGLDITGASDAAYSIVDKHFRTVDGKDVSGIIFSVNDNTPESCDPDLAVIKYLRENVV